MLVTYDSGALGSAVDKYKHTALAERLKGRLEQYTKVLKIQSSNSHKRKLVISSNFLNVFNFCHGDKVVEEVGAGCMKVRPANADDQHTKLVYQRRYRNRDNYVETMMDIRHQGKIAQAFGNATHAHITFEQELLTIKRLYAAELSPTEVSMDVCQRSDGLYVGVIDCLRYIRSEKPAKVICSGNPDFLGTGEHTILDMQLRRLGYQTSTVPECGSVIGIHSGANQFDALQKIDLGRNLPIPKVKEPKSVNALDTAVVCTGGVDVFCLNDHGYSVTSATEFKPVEERDICKKTGKVVDKTEDYITNVAFNGNTLKRLHNENVYDIYDSGTVQKGEPVLHWSLECSDFSLAKSPAAKKRHIQDLTSTRDMFVMLLVHTERYQPAHIAIENVPMFLKSCEYGLMTYGLEQLGFDVQAKALNAEHYGGYSKRERAYVVASRVTGFNWPEPVVNDKHFWNDLVAPYFRKTGHDIYFRSLKSSKTMFSAVEHGRDRFLTQGVKTSNAIMRSQNRGVKDSLVIFDQGEFFDLNVPLLQKINCIPEGFDTSLCTKEQSVEIIGQSICYELHSQIMLALKKHILQPALRVIGAKEETATDELIVNSHGQVLMWA